MTMSLQSKKIFVIGGGIQGCATAYFLAKRGQNVTLIEKDRIGRHASGVNAGGVRRLGRDILEIPLSLAAMDIWQNLYQEIGEYAKDFHPCFYLKVAVDEAGREIGLMRAENLSRAGFTHEVWVEDDYIQARLPHLSTPTEGGLLVEGDGWATPWRIVQGFANVAKKHGAKIIEDCPVTSLTKFQDFWKIQTAKGLFEAETVVNCAGAWSAGIARSADDHIFPLEAYAPMLVVTDKRPKILPAVMGVLAHTLSLKQLETGQFVIGGGVRSKAHTSIDQSDVTLPKLSSSMKLASKLFSEIGNAQVIRCWSGIEGYMPDNLPVIGRGRQNGLFHGFGFSAHGFQLGPGVGEALADLVMGQQPRISLKPFRPDRFVN